MIGDRLDGQIDASLRVALLNYLKIASNEKPSRMNVASSIPAQYSRDFNVLLCEHNKIAEFFHKKFFKRIWDEIVDLYLTDFKYGNKKCAKRLSRISNLHGGSKKKS